MHAGLRGIDPMTGNVCPQAHPTTLVNGKDEASLREPFTYSTALNDNHYGGPRSGCPNQWAVREGYLGQVIGFQTSNSVTTTDDLSSTLWNGTLNSNMVFLEAYEIALWRARQQRLSGDAILSRSAEGYADVVSREKSLAAWTAELHRRRRTIASYAGNAVHASLRDPFPATYSFTFRKDLAPGAVETIHFVNPAARCTSGTSAYATITITGM